MIFGTRNRNISRKTMLVLALLAMSVFAWGQHDKEPKESHQSKPSKPATQNRGGSNRQSQSRESGQNRPSRPNQGGAQGARPGGTNNNNRPGNNNNAGRPANAPNRTGEMQGNRGNTPGNRGGNPGMNRGNPGADRGGNPRANRGGNPGFNRGGANAGNRGAMGNRPAPGRSVSLRGGGTASIRPNGQIRSINRNGMAINRNLRGGRVVVAERGGARIVTVGRGRGYVQRAYVVRGGRSFYSRTYYDHGVIRVGVYRGYNYGGFHYYGYYPSYWYRPAFYGWAYRPWGPPIAWGIGVGGWGWAGSPWFGFYGGFFSPYPVYPSAAFWLTDYLISADLQAAYAARADANAEAEGAYDDQGASNQGAANYDNGGGQQASASVTLTPEVKQAIAEEVKAQLAAQQAQADSQASTSGGQGQAPEAANGEVPPALDPARRTFVVYSNLTVVSDGQECELTAGDVLTRLTDTPDADQKVTASVSASKKNDCGAGKQVSVLVDDLQDMRNHFEEQLDNGMKTLAEKQGTGGLPKAPDTGTTASDVPPPQPDSSVAKDISDQDAAADQAETEAKQEASQGPGGNQ